MPGPAAPAALPHLSAHRLAVSAEAYRAAARVRRGRVLRFALALAALAALSAWVAEVNLGRLSANIGGFFGYFDRLLTLEAGPRAGQRVWTDPGEWLWGWRKWGLLLADTLLIAYVGTVLGAAGGFCLAFASAANLVRRRWVRSAAKRLLELCRTVPDIVFALVFVIAFGLGPVPGVLAVAVHSLGALGKQSAEAVENVSMKPVEAAAAGGASWVEVVRFAALPQVLPNLASYALLRFEINVRQASVLGFVGAGGIGQDLIEAIRKFYYNDVAALLLLIVLTVMLTDLAAERLRHRLIGREVGR